MAWFTRTRKNINNNKQKDMPDGLWTKCRSCGEIIFKKQLEDNLFTCTNCDYHFRVSSGEFVNILFDEGTFEEKDLGLNSADPLEFVDTKKYPDRLEAGRKKTGLEEAMTIGVGKIYGLEVSAALMNFNFVGGSMGSVVGEKFFRAAKRAIDKKIPLICVSASGGARMQEAALSLMQMAKTAAILTELAEAKLPYVSILTDPTTGGVTASYSMLGDVNIAEPGALIGFAGPRVIEETIRRKLPKGFQRSEALLKNGFVDMIVHRKEMKNTLYTVLKWFDPNS